MIPREYFDPLVNDISYISQVIITVVAYIFNILLLFITHKSSRGDIGSYRVLIAYFAISDLYYNTLHFAVYPIPEMYGNAFIMSGHGLYRELLGVGLYIGAYGHVFPILIFHFLYRLMAIKYPYYLQHFPLFLIALVVCTAASNVLWFSIFYWFFHPDEESLRILTPIFNGSITLPIIHTINSAEKHVQALYWAGETFKCPRWRNLIGIGLMFFSMGCTYAIIIRCGILINRYLKDRMNSALSIRLHRQLFLSLIFQSFVPLITAYYPAGTAVMLPLFGITIHCVSIVVPPACATHPLLDPLILMLTISEYRKYFFTLTGIAKLACAFNFPTSSDTTITILPRASIASNHSNNAKHAVFMLPRHGPIDTVNFVAGIMLNSVLLYQIHRFSRKELGAYKHLLTIFAVHDIFLSLTEAVFNVAAFRVGHISGIVGRIFWESTHIASAYSALYTIPFFLTNVNFLYRYWAIKWYLAAMFICTGEVDEPATFEIREAPIEIREANKRVMYNVTIRDGWIVMDHWRNNTFQFRPFIVVLLADCLIIFSFITASSLASLTFYYIHINTWVSDYYRKSQKTVLIALCAQSIVPLLCIYVPYTNNLNAPLLGVEDLIASEKSALFISAFPLWDAIVIILLMRDYRLGAMSLLFPRKQTNNSATTRVNASSIVVPSEMMSGQVNTASVMSSEVR